MHQWHSPKLEKENGLSNEVIGVVLLVCSACPCPVGGSAWCEVTRRAIDYTCCTRKVTSTFHGPVFISWPLHLGLKGPGPYITFRDYFPLVPAVMMSDVKLLIVAVHDLRHLHAAMLIRLILSQPQLH